MEKENPAKGAPARDNFIGDFFLMAVTALIGLAEMAHLAAVFLKWPFSRCALFFGCLAGAAGVLGFGLLFFVLRKRCAGTGRALVRPALPEALLYAFFAALALSQLIFLCAGNTMYRGGDMTAETVGSFLAADSVYRVNPLTGAPYTGGIPLRLKILCLPSLYASLCRWTGLRPAALVQTAVPVAVWFGSYVSFYVLACSFFPDDAARPRQRRRRACFMAVVALLLWAGSYREGMDGFGILFAAWRGAVIRNVVLMPWLVSLCLRRKWLCAMLCIMAEACITWTWYGCGACAAVAFGMAASRMLCGRVLPPAAADGGKERQG